MSKGARLGIDSDGTTVIAPRVRFPQDFGRTGGDFVYGADVWTSAGLVVRALRGGHAHLVPEDADDLRRRSGGKMAAVQAGYEAEAEAQIRAAIDDALGS